MVGRDPCQTSASDLALGVDIVHAEKQGNDIKLLGTCRIEPELGLLDEYARLRGAYWHAGFRRQRVLNLFARAPWYAGFGRYLATKPRAITIDSTTFRHDARQAFKQITETHMPETRVAGEKSLEELIYQVVNVYISGKLKAKYGLEWKETNGNDDKEKEYTGHREKIAKGAFLAVRSRTGEDFVQYFSSTLFSVPQHVGEAGYLAITRTLVNDPETVRTLTLLALSARG
jgi:CRISPR-associated protein Cmx8